MPKNDEFFGEYVDPSNERLKYLTGFSGSAGQALILKKKAFLFVDILESKILTGTVMIKEKKARLKNICNNSNISSNVITVSYFIYYLKIC